MPDFSNENKKLLRTYRDSGASAEAALRSGRVQPIVKWSGSKRSQADAIVSEFPADVSVYFEPFVGSGAVLFRLMSKLLSAGRTGVRLECSDSNRELILLWNRIKDDPEGLLLAYAARRAKFALRAGSVDALKEYYSSVRDDFNRRKLSGEFSADTADEFFWLRRTAFNGLVRYNSRGEFNAPCHFTRLGIEPEKLAPVLRAWSDALRRFEVRFSCRPYWEVPSDSGGGAFYYLDPPYGGTAQMYGADLFDEERFFRWLPGKRFALSYNGRRSGGGGYGFRDGTRGIPKELYSRMLYLKSGKSSFDKFNRKGGVDVEEALYLSGEWASFGGVANTQPEAEPLF